MQSNTQIPFLTFTRFSYWNFDPQLARTTCIQDMEVFLLSHFLESNRRESLALVEHQQVPESGKEREMPPYILFLTGSYKSECRAWEIERLVRKMLLSLLTSTIPVSYSPALQMLVVSGILIVSMGLHYHFMPYKVSWTVSLNVPSPLRVFYCSGSIRFLAWPTGRFQTYMSAVMHLFSLFLGLSLFVVVVVVVVVCCLLATVSQQPDVQLYIP